MTDQSALEAPTTPWLGGYEWNPLAVDWTKGPSGTWRKHTRRGQPAKGTQTWTVSLRDSNFIGDAVYALHRSVGTVYIGKANYTSEPQLTKRLRAHWESDKLVNRWTKFTWIARNHAFKGSDAVPTSTDFIELIAVRFANPVDNGQVPKLDQQVTWLDQVPVKDLYSPEEMLEKIFLLG